MEVEKLLRQKQLKVTPQRKTILNVLQKSDCVLNAQQIFEEAVKALPGVNFSTVYRNLDILLERDIICRLTSPEGKVLFKLRSEGSHHHHIICKGCGISVPIDFCPMNILKNELGIKGFTHTEHRFEIYGYCDECQKEIKQRS